MSIMAYAYLSQSVVTPHGITPAAVLVEGETILSVGPVSDLPPNTPTRNLGSLAILPGLVDTHVHINEPGRTEWEGFHTATRAAAAGGFTTLVDMPLNCLPETTNVPALEAKRRAAAGQCLVDWSPWGGAVADNQADILPLARAGVPGFKCFLIYPGCEGFTMIDRAQLEASLPAIAQSGLPLLVHAELAGPIEAAAPALAHADWRKYSTYLASRPDEAELEAIRLLIHLCRQYKFRLHIVHLSTAHALPDLRAAKAEGLPITVETCPHYLFFTADEIPDGNTLFKCAPPIRSEANREALWQALRDGTIDLIATDHSPCPPEMKRLPEGRFDQAWGGIASLSVALSAVWTEASKRIFTLADVTRWLSHAPATLASLSNRAGSLAPGREATFTIFDPEATWQVTPEDLHFRHPVSPYVGQRLKGKVLETWQRGTCLFPFNAIPHALQGREILLPPKPDVS